MQGSMRSIVVAFMALGMFASRVAWAQDYPVKPVKLVMPFAPGGATDLFARLVSQKMGESMGQPVVLDYKPGAASMIANEAVATAPKDGYTLLVGTTGMALNLIMYSKVPYRMEDFAPVSVIAVPAFAMSVGKGSQARNAKEFIDFVKARPGKVNYANIGSGSTPHLLAKMLEDVAGLQMQDIPYKGAGPALTALASGEVQLYFDSVTTSIPQHKSGTIKILGFTSAERLPAALDVPTLKEQGIPLVATSWFGIMAPAGTPRPVIDKLHREVQKAVNSKDYQAKVSATGATPAASSSPEEFAALIESMTQLWGRIPSALKIKFD